MMQLKKLLMLLNKQKTNSLTVGYALQQAKQQLENIENSYLDSLLLLQKVTLFSKEQLIFNLQQTISPLQFKTFSSLVKKRKNHHPIAYLLGYKEFFDLKFFVNKHTLIPRPDSEILVEQAIKYCQKNLSTNNIKILDLCCGSGCLGITMLKNITNASLVTCDINKNAVAMAKKNAKYHLVDKKTKFITSNLFDDLKKYTNYFDIIITNPPYIKTSIIFNLQPEVKNFEPFLALNGREDGLYFYRQIAKQANIFLTAKGNLFVEIGHDQEKSVIKIFQQSNEWNYIKSYNDLSGITRVLQFQIKI